MRTKTIKDIEKYWTELTAKHLEGKKIVKVEYLPAEMLEDFMWYKRPITIHLDDGTILVPQSDDEGNDGGAMLTNTEELQVIPVI